MRWSRNVSSKINQQSAKVSYSGAFYVWAKGCLTCPTNTDYDGAEEIVFDSPYAGEGSFVIIGQGFEDGTRVALNGVDLGEFSNDDTTNEIRYEVNFNNLIEGLNSFRIWSTAGSSGELRRLEAWRNFVHDITNTMRVDEDGNITFGNFVDVPGVYWDGSIEYARATTTLDNLSDSKVFTLATRIRFKGSGTREDIFTGTALEFAVYKDTDDKIKLSADASVAGDILEQATTSTYDDTDGWLDILISVDLENNSKAQMYINGTDDADTATTFTDDSINFTVGEYSFAGREPNPNSNSGEFDVQFFWLDITRAIDFSTVANRRLFFKKNRDRAGIGIDGAVNGTTPLIYFVGDASSFHINRGNGGDKFTLTGTPTDVESYTGDQFFYSTDGIYSGDATGGSQGPGTMNITDYYDDGKNIKDIYHRNLNVDTTQTGTVGSGEDDLITYSLPADTLDTDGFAIHITAFGTTAANGNNKTIKLYLGSTELTAAAAQNPNDEDWAFEATVIRTGASAGKSIVEFLSNDSSDDTVSYVSLSEDWSTALTIKCTGEGTSDNDIVQEALIVEFRPV